MNISNIQYASAGCTIAFSSLSIFGGFVIFWTYWLIPSVRNFTRKLLLYLTLADILNASGTLFGTINFLSNNSTENVVCKAQAYITTFAAMASFFWTLVITAHLMVAIQFQSNRTRSAILQVLYHAVCWGIPGIIIVVAGSENVLGPSYRVTGMWCFINDNLTSVEKTTWILISGKGWEILCYILSLSILVLLKLKLYFSRRRLRELNADFRDEDTHFLYLWLLLWLLRVWGTIRFLLDWFGVYDPDFLLILQSIGDNAQAFGNFILFCLLDKEVMEHIKNECMSPRAGEDEHERLIPTSEGQPSN
ncbi:hypothetical protein ACJMK2_027256 [Sinanodonta woodiana]|uniref:G-protein coupled receptors family 2 profile 2 domain-containing protein n=1 Tax=Sinanodonta woodiana TaxID=1069815 RepID=A0ABD3XM85_SINWO